MVNAGSYLSKYRFLGVIPARGGSKGIPRKNLVDVAGKPLIAYTIEAARGSGRLDRVLLSTDSEEIAVLGRKLGVEVPFMRPVSLAMDDTPIISVLRHAVDHIESAEGYRPTAVVLLQPTSPLRTAAHIDAAIELFEKEDADSVVSVSEPMEHPSDMVWFENGHIRFALAAEERWKGRQTYPKFYFVNGAIYILTLELLPKTEHPWGGRVVPFPMGSLESIDVDGPTHLILADWLLQRTRSAGDE